MVHALVDEAAAARVEANQGRRNRGDGGPGSGGMLLLVGRAEGSRLAVADQTGIGDYFDDGAVEGVDLAQRHLVAAVGDGDRVSVDPNLGDLHRGMVPDHRPGCQPISSTGVPTVIDHRGPSGRSTTWR